VPLSMCCKPPLSFRFLHMRRAFTHIQACGHMSKMLNTTVLNRYTLLVSTLQHILAKSRTI
jgi:hypothetical protein